MEKAHRKDSPRRLNRILRRTKESLEEAWEHTQTASFTNSGVKHAAITMADVGALTVHSVFHTLRLQTLRIGTSSHGQQDDVLATYTNSIPLTSKSLLRDGISKVVAQAATAPETTTL